MVAVAQPKVEYVAVNRFADFAVDEQIKRNITAKGFTTPTPIQDQAIKPILAGRDLVGTAATGTGKTGAFLIPLIHKVITKRTSRVLIMIPTRELAVQIKKEIVEFSQGLNILTALCIGGSNMNRQIDDLKRKPDFVVGTPGRLKDLYQQRKLKLFDFDTVVLDEVDRMLDMGFIRDVREMINALPRVRHSLFFSATITGPVENVMRDFLSNPVSIAVEGHKPAANVKQHVIKINGRAKIDLLRELLREEGFDKVLVFGRTKRGMEKLYRQLDQLGFRVAAIHGNKTQSQRQRALRQFQDNQVQVLIATDVVGRGIDIDNVTHVINFDLPESYEDYIHRIGRTGRADKTGIALTFV
jgi:superfamily II DNA/RNA helicase